MDLEPKVDIFNIGSTPRMQPVGDDDIATETERKSKLGES